MDSFCGEALEMRESVLRKRSLYVWAPKKGRGGGRDNPTRLTRWGPKEKRTLWLFSTLICIRGKRAGLCGHCTGGERKGGTH